MPKCSNKINPSMPIHPRSNGKFVGTCRAKNHRQRTPRTVLKQAPTHSRAGGLNARTSPSRNDSALIPGQSRRYAAERHRSPECHRAFHQVNHLRDRKKPNASAHIKPHAGKRGPKTIANDGSRTKGKKATHRSRRGCDAAVGCFSPL
jgi:hypothetical protein